MGLLEKLDQLMLEHGLNKNTLAQYSGVPYTTIDGLYKKGYENMKLSTLKKLCAYFDVTLDYLAKDDVEKAKSDYPLEPEKNLSEREKEILTIYRSLNRDGQDLALATMRTYGGNPNMRKVEQNATAM